MKWDYVKRTVDLSMSGYVKKALLKFKHEKTKTAVDAPYKHTPIIYGAKQQYAETETSPKLIEKEIKID